MPLPRRTYYSLNVIFYWIIAATSQFILFIFQFFIIFFNLFFFFIFFSSLVVHSYVLQPPEPEPAPAPVVNQSIYYPTPRPQIVTQNAYAINYQPYSPPPLRYSGVSAYGSGGVLYGNFPARQGPSNLFSDFFKPESDAFWK